MDAQQLVIRESVRQTLADYTAATDRFDLAALTACFSTEGVLDFTGGAQALTGRTAIETGLREAVTKTPDPTRLMPSHVRHHVSSIRFGPMAADRVEVSSYFAVLTDIGLDHWGRYRDVLVPEEGRWLFSHRRVSVDGFAADSLMA
jgi:SnoaL-like protein